MVDLSALVQAEVDDWRMRVATLGWLLEFLVPGFVAHGEVVPGFDLELDCYVW